MNRLLRTVIARLKPPRPVPEPACIGCQAAKNKLAARQQIIAHCRICGQQFSRKA